VGRGCWRDSVAVPITFLIAAREGQVLQSNMANGRDLRSNDRTLWDEGVEQRVNSKWTAGFCFWRLHTLKECAWCAEIFKFCGFAQVTSYPGPCDLLVVSSQRLPVTAIVCGSARNGNTYFASLHTICQRTWGNCCPVFCTRVCVCASLWLAPSPRRIHCMLFLHIEFALICNMKVVLTVSVVAVLHWLMEVPSPHVNCKCGHHFDKSSLHETDGFRVCIHIHIDSSLCVRKH
jgi:hypothetical protein